jgi:hypothetical protein
VNDTPYRILVTGSRDWDDDVTIYYALRDDVPFLDRQPLVVHGAARGADAIADVAARMLRYRVERHPALWRQHGVYNPQAGLARNRRMVELGADICLAFIRNGSRGASHTAALAEQAGIPTRRWTA